MTALGKGLAIYTGVAEITPGPGAAICLGKDRMGGS